MQFLVDDEISESVDGCCPKRSDLDGPKIVRPKPTQTVWLKGPT